MTEPLSRRWIIQCGSLAISAGLGAAGAGSASAAEHGRTWVTRAYVHFDRTASPWLIKRFIDPDATFVFVEWGHEDQAPKDAIPFALPGAKLAPHDDQKTTFQRLVDDYGLHDEALDAMARIIAAGVNYVLHGVRPAAGDKYAELAYGILALSDGMLLVSDSDAEILTRAFVNYDALYATIRADILVREHALTIPPPNGQGPGPKTKFLRQLLKSG